MWKWLALAAAALAALPLTLVLLVSAAASPGSAAGIFGHVPTALARADIPAAYLVVYMDAAQTCPALPWPVLAGVGKVESDHGRSRLPGVHVGKNQAGAEGPMQLLPGTFTAYAVDGDHDGRLDPYDPADAVFTAAAMLCANGAASGTAGGLSQAVLSYNHSLAYAAAVFSWAARYTAPAANLSAGARTGTASRVAAAAIGFALAQLGKPYVWGAAGPDAYDCSGLVYAAYTAAGVHIARTTFQWRDDGPQVPLSGVRLGDLLFSAGSDGTAQTALRSRSAWHRMSVAEVGGMAKPFGWTASTRRDGAGWIARSTALRVRQLWSASGAARTAIRTWCLSATSRFPDTRAGVPAG